MSIRDELKDALRRLESAEKQIEILTKNAIIFGWALDILGEKGYFEKGEIEAYGRTRIRDSYKSKKEANGAGVDSP